MRLLRLVVFYIIDFARANVSLAVQVLSPRMKLEQGSIELETRAHKPLEILAISNMITFTPGTLLLDVKPGERITVHVLGDLDEAAQVIREHLEQPLLDLTQGER